jgi:hypothetical protein
MPTATSPLWHPNILEHYSSTSHELDPKTKKSPKKACSNITQSLYQRIRHRLTPDPPQVLDTVSALPAMSALPLQDVADIIQQVRDSTTSRMAAGVLPQMSQPTLYISTYLRWYMAARMHVLLSINALFSACIGSALACLFIGRLLAVEPPCRT